MNDDTESYGNNWSGFVSEGTIEISPHQDLMVQHILAQEVDSEIHLG